MSPSLERIVVRAARDDDARAILETHFDAVHSLAAGAYPQDVLDDWSGPVDEARMAGYLNDGADIKLVAESDGIIAGFGEAVTQDNLLLACYVAAPFAGLGIGRRIVATLERKAKAKGVRELFLDSSLNAQAFYRKCGYRTLEKTTHELRSGRTMACARMCKSL